MPMSIIDSKSNNIADVQVARETLGDAQLQIETQEVEQFVSLNDDENLGYVVVSFIAF